VRLFFSVLLFAITLAIPGSALANPEAGHYKGAAKRDPARLRFEVHNGRLSGFNAARVRFECRDHRTRRRNPLTLEGGLEVARDGRFGGRLRHSSRRRSFTAKVRGRLVRKGGRASGVVRYHLAFRHGDRCSSAPSRVRWAARNRDLLFASGFQKPVAVLAPVIRNDNWRFPIVGADRGFAWQSDLPGPHAFIPVVPASEPVDQYAATRTERVMGPYGKPTRSLYQEVTRDAKLAPRARVRNQFPLKRERRGKIAYWIKLQGNLRRVMPPGERSWRLLMELRKSHGGRRRSDFRISVGLIRRPGRPIVWRVEGDRLRPSYKVKWRYSGTRPRVPIGRWFRLKVAWLIDRSHGRLRVIVNHAPIARYHGPTRLDRPVNSIQIFKVYTGADSLAQGPAYQWIDDVELRRWRRTGG
jgi:hypothetical protein